MHLEMHASPDANSGRIGRQVEGRLESAVLPHGFGFSACVSRCMHLKMHASLDANSGRIGMVALRGKRQRWGPSCLHHPSNSMLGENSLAAKISKGSLANEGMGEGGHNMPLHSRWWEGWGRG